MSAYVCDCGQHFAELDQLYTCQASGHRDSGYLEAVDALEAFPESERDEAWQIARAELERLR